MKAILFNSTFILGVALLISCDQPQEKKIEPITKTQTSPEPVQKKSSANFIEIASHANRINSSESRQRRIYYVYVENYADGDAKIWTDMVNFAYDKPFDDRGMTFVFFFKDRNAPSLSDGNISRLTDVDTYTNTCIAAYWHYPNGSEEMKKYPFKD